MVAKGAEHHFNSSILRSTGFAVLPCTHAPAGNPAPIFDGFQSETGVGDRPGNFIKHRIASIPGKTVTGIAVKVDKVVRFCCYGHRNISGATIRRKPIAISNKDTTTAVLNSTALYSASITYSPGKGRALAAASPLVRSTCVRMLPKPRQRPSPAPGFAARAPD